MSEKKETRCCGDVCFEVLQTEKGVAINITTEDNEKRKALKSIALCCGDAAKDASDADCCK